MADLAISLSKTTVESVVNKVKSAIKEEAELLQMVQRDLVFITDEFEMMQSFLNSAAADRIMNNVVRTWVRQVRDLSYDTEDCIESVLHLDIKRSFWTLWRRLLASCKPGGGPLALDQVVAEIKLLKARVEDVSQRNMRYSLIGDSTSEAAVVKMTTSRARKLGIVNEARDTAKELISGFSDLAGLITNEDSDDDRLHVISVWGTGDDLGAVSMIKDAYDDPEVYNNFRYRAWVKLMHPLNPHKFMRTLVAQFYTNSCHKQQVIDRDVLTWVEATQGADLVEVFAKQVNQQRYLVVLEDLSSMAEWQAVRTYLPDTKNRSRIVISTQQHEIATSCIGHPYQVLELNHISDNHSVCVFFKEGQGTKEGRRGGPSRLEPSHKEEEFRLVGRDSEVTKLCDLILKDHMDKSRVVYVWGMPGVGKSALVKTIYRRWAYEKYAWVNVSYPFQLMDFCRGILLSMLSGAYRVTDPIQECRKLLHKDRCLLVIDGLHSQKDWDIIYTKLVREPSDWDMKLIRESYDSRQEERYGSRLSCIVITTEEQIARHAVTSHDAVCNVPVLKDDGALDLFRQVLHREMMAHVDEDIIRHVLDEEAKLLLPNCGGLPSVIVALGRYLAHLHTLQRGIYDREWKRLNSNMKRELETNPEFESLRGLFAQMRANFEACPQILKKCIFYLSVFPQNSIIRRRRLVRRWLAEGYSSGTDQGTSLEEGAEKLVDQLDKMGIIRAPVAAAMARDMRMTSWKVNSFLLEYIISQKAEGALFLPLEVSVLEGNCSRVSTGRVGQHLAIGSSWKRDEFMFNSLDLSRLRSLTVIEQWEPFFISNKMRVLRVLDLEGASNNVKNGDLEQIGEKLPRLKFLSLRGCREVSLLPDSLGDLRQLQTLDIRDTCVNALPKSIIKLLKLQYIRAGRGFALPWIDDNGLATGAPSTSSSRPVGTLAPYLSKASGAAAPSGAQDGVKLPRGIGRLKSLQTLGAVNVVSTARGNAILAELHHHKQLKKLQVSGINQTNSRRTPLVFPGHLESLAIRGNMLPRNIRFPDNLIKLSLEVTMLSTPENMIQAIGKLEKLHTLRLFLKMVPTTRWELHFSAKPDHSGSNAPGQFIELKVLEIGCTSGLCVNFGEEAATKLEQLKVHRPNGSSLEFCGLKYPISLKLVCV